MTSVKTSSHRYGYELAMAALGMRELCVGREALQSGTIAHLFRLGDKLSIDGCVRPTAAA